MAHNDTPGCNFCDSGPVIKTKEEISFHQWTDKGYVHCETVIPIGICAHCGAKNWMEAADAIIEESIRVEYKKLK
jgi:hypothetical protein